MNIVVCIKQVPDAPNIRIDRERMTIIRDGVESIINPLDRVALEAALDLKLKEGGTVSVLTMGPSQSEEALRESMAAGADQAILLTDPLFAGADTLATSKVIGSAISRMDPFPDLILCGRQTIDSDTGHVGHLQSEPSRAPHGFDGTQRAAAHSPGGFGGGVFNCPGHSMGVEGPQAPA